MNALEGYLAEVATIHSSGAGVPETSYYPALSDLFNEIGKDLSPRVRTIITLKNRGAGLPDGGFFTGDQVEKMRGGAPIPTLPARGALEVKPASEDAFLTASGEQVTRYWREYRQVLVTNLRDFVLVGQDPNGRPVKLETFRLASGEREFWRVARDPKKLRAHTAAAFVEYLTRVLLQPAALVSPKDLAFFLASYARDASARLEGASLSVLDGLRTALEDALGLKFEGKKGEHFFRASLVQTLFYGVFSAWTIWSKQASAAGARFDWRLSAHYLQVPIIRKLFHEVSEPGQLTSLHLAEVLDWAGATLNRVDRAPFFARFATEDAIQYFYEPFLEAYDPELRKGLGVWYTRPDVVKYIVARVDSVLRTRHGIPDGLADARVYVLDPAAGTGSFLVEVVRRIAQSVHDKEGAALAPASAKAAALQRVFGFELLPAPFVVAHLQLGRLLQELGAPLDEKKAERASVYLTNSLTGWNPPSASRARLLFPELEAERDLAEHVKRDTPVLVVLGNPPYNAFAGVSPKEELGLVEPYKQGLVSKWGIRKFNLDDLYVRFFRLAERRIADMTGEGIVAYISNFSYLSTPLRKSAHVFGQAALRSVGPSLWRRLERSLRVKRHSKGLAMVW